MTRFVSCLRYTYKLARLRTHPVPPPPSFASDVVERSRRPGPTSSHLLALLCPSIIADAPQMSPSNSCCYPLAVSAEISALTTLSPLPHTFPSPPLLLMKRVLTLSCRRPDSLCLLTVAGILISNFHGAVSARRPASCATKATRVSCTPAAALAEDSAPGKYALSHG